MINLLPDDTKKQIQAARMNVSLVRYIIVIGLSLTFLALACTVSYFFLVNTKIAAEESILDNQPGIDNSASAEAQATSLRNNLLGAKNILNREIRYSEVITGIAAAMPSGVILDSLSLDNSTFGAPITLQARARDTESALKLKDNFQSSPLFSNFSLQTLSTNQGGSSDYPVSVTISVTINKGSSL